MYKRYPSVQSMSAFIHAARSGSFSSAARKLDQGDFARKEVSMAKVVVADALQPGQTKSQGQAPHTLGILCKPEHAAFAHFPTEFHSNWQWWDLCVNSRAISLEGLGIDTPIVRVIDNFVTNVYFRYHDHVFWRNIFNVYWSSII